MKAARKNLSEGRVRYSVILDAEEAALVEAGSSLESVSPESWIASSLTIRMIALAAALDAIEDGAWRKTSLN